MTKNNDPKVNNSGEASSFYFSLLEPLLHFFYIENETSLPQ